MFFKVVERRDKESLLDILRTFVLPGTTVYSTFWRSYDCLEDEAFHQLAADNLLHFINLETGVHTNKIEGTWSAVKKTSLPRRTASDQFDSYLAEYVWRKANAGKDLAEAFYEAAVLMYPPQSQDPPYEDNNVTA